MLHVTNGDVAAERIREAIGRGLVPAGEVVAWRDPLHEGPVPAGLADGELARVRAEFIAGRGWGGRAEALAGFTARDAALANGVHGEVALWFESDLYDQLQLLQLLDRLAGGAAAGARRTLVAVGPEPRSGRFVALGGLEPEALAERFARRREIGDAELDLGRSGWEAFRAPDPGGIETLRAELGRRGHRDPLDPNGEPLPDLAPALRRHLEEFPWVEGGLDRTARRALADLAAGARSGGDLFEAHLAAEERPFLGDVIFRDRLADLARGPRPLLEPEGAAAGETDGLLAGGGAWKERSVRLTPAGRDVLAGRADAVALNGVDRWLGGVHLTGRRAAWRWDPAAERLVDGTR